MTKKLQKYYGAAILMLSTTAHAQTAFDLEGVTAGTYQGSFSVSDGPLLLSLTPEGNPSGYIIINDFGVPLLGRRAAVAVNEPTGAQGFLPVRFTFNRDVAATTFNFGDGGGDDDGTVTIAAFSSLGVFLGSQSTTYGANVADGRSLSMNYSGTRYYLASSTGSAGGYNANSVAFDISAVSTNVQALPELSTWAMLIAGTIAIGWAARSHRSAWRAAAS